MENGFWELVLSLLIVFLVLVGLIFYMMWGWVHSHKWNPTKNNNKKGD